MQNSFISVVGVINRPYEIRGLASYLKDVYAVLSQNFSDYEIILLNNAVGPGIEEEIEQLPADLKKNIYLLNLSVPVNKNHALLAGLDRANGDYTVIFEQMFSERARIILDLFEKTKNGFDIVYLQAKERRTRIGFFYKIFYYILRNYSDLAVDEKAHDTRIISRRALNSLLRMRENLRYMKAIYSLVGYPTTALPVDEPLEDYSSGFDDRVKTSLVAITSFTSFFRSVSLWIFVLSLLFAVVVIFNAVLVRVTNYDVFGDYHQAVSGWTFLVVLISVFFSVMFLNLYVVSIYLANIYQEMKARPMYILESVKRF